VHPLILTAMAMVAFAANSILCRMALGSGQIDAVSFTTLRLLSGALLLLSLQAWRRRHRPRLRLKPASVLALFAYALCFSLAYTRLTAASGALILFCLVQSTMVIYGLVSGERPGWLAWSGLLLALAGLVYLLSPGITMPSPVGALLMSLAGIAWGAYSLLGRQALDPVEATANNFSGAAALAVLASLVFGLPAIPSASGALLAVLSGAIASGLGYVIWYSALPALTPVQAASVQLSVPMLAAIAGALLLAEPLTPRLLLSSIVILGGLALVILGRQKLGRQPVASRRS